MLLFITFLFLGLVHLFFGETVFGIGLIISSVSITSIDLYFNYQNQKEYNRTEFKTIVIDGEKITIPETGHLPRKWWYFWETV